MGILVLILLVDALLGKNSESKAINGLKTVLFIGLIAIFGNMLVKGKVNMDGNLQGAGIKESFEVKAVTSIIATPDEIYQALTDQTQRTLWDT